MIRNIQMLRALAACLVVFVHLDQLLARLGLERFGYGGVDIFFVVSGFIMVHTNRVQPLKPGAFFLNRIARIVPLYWLVTLAVFAIALVAPSLMQATHADFTELAKSLFFIPFTKSNGLVEPVLFVGWTLNYEMFFYLLFALGLATRNVALGSAFVAVILAALVGYGWFAPQLSNSVAYHFYSSPIVLEFAFGMAVALAAPHLPRAAPKFALLLAILVSVLCIGEIIAAPLLYPQIPSLLSCGVPATAIVTTAVLAEQQGWIVRNRIVLAVGNASFALYLIHPFVTQASQKLAQKFTLDSGMAFAAICLTFVAVGIVAVLVHKLVERPASKLARQILLLGASGARQAPAIP